MKLVESGHRLSLLDDQKVALRPAWVNPRAVYVSRFLNTHPGSTYADIQTEADHLFPEANGRHLPICHGSDCRCYELALRAFPPPSDDERIPAPAAMVIIYLFSALAAGAGLIYLVLR